MEGGEGGRVGGSELGGKLKPLLVRSGKERSVGRRFNAIASWLVNGGSRAER